MIWRGCIRFGRSTPRQLGSRRHGKETVGMAPVGLRGGGLF